MANNARHRRSARHIALPAIGSDGQRRIDEGTVLLIGVGGIGCAAASYLASAGVGHLLLCDFDTVDDSNLGRQILYGPEDVGMPKAERAALHLARINPDIRLTAIASRLSDAALHEAVSQSDVVLDGSDNFATRFAVSDACVNNERMLVSGAAIRFEGQLAVFGADYAVSPCYRCLYREADESLDNCAGNGVLAAVPGLIGTAMAVETLKSLAGIAPATGRLTLFDGMSSEWRTLEVPKRPDCPACG
jgi:adenylyltransferase/sulfurtransferase